MRGTPGRGKRPLSHDALPLAEQVRQVALVDHTAGRGVVGDGERHGRALLDHAARLHQPTESNLAARRRGLLRRLGRREEEGDVVLHGPQRQADRQRKHRGSRGTIQRRRRALGDFGRQLMTPLYPCPAHAPTGHPAASRRAVRSARRGSAGSSASISGVQSSRALATSPRLIARSPRKNRAPSWLGSSASAWVKAASASGWTSPSAPGPGSRRAVTSWSRLQAGSTGRDETP
jgi:hypothetical protein